MMKVPFLDVRSGYIELKAQVDDAVGRVLDSGLYIRGSEVEQFEAAWARYCGARHCVGVGNGLDALRLGLQALGVGPGDEVLVPAHTFIATWLAVSALGAVPVPIDADAATYNVDVSRIEAAITDRTRAIIPVHLYGQPVDLDPLLEIARRYELWVLEDAAQAHGARYKDRRIGSHGDAVAWSFYPGKNLGAFGDAGALTTNSREIADRVAVLGNYGSRVKYVHECQGLNSRMDSIQAAVLLEKLKVLDEWNVRRAAVADRYITGLRGSGAGLATVPAWASPAWHLFVVTLDERDRIRAALERDGIETGIHYPAIPARQQAYGKPRGETYGVAERLASRVLSLPMGPHVSAEQSAWVVDRLRAALRP
jgi:dTDP-4-amino-4,6-dideoxygalactose transaminase